MGSQQEFSNQQMAFISCLKYLYENIKYNFEINSTEMGIDHHCKR